jgi:L-ascorbate metabolism protein UlaG (beta-lactamase superfamily)
MLVSGYLGRIMAGVNITFVGHSTTLIQSDNISILTDPIFSGNVLCLKRAEEPGIKPGELPDISAVLISHTHLDHLDYASFNYLKTSVPIVVPEGSSKGIGKNLPNPIIELSTWASHDFANDFKIQSVPANHSSSVLCPYHYKKASGYIVEIAGKNILFAGDSAYGTNFRDIGKTYQIDVALLPIGSYKPAFFMKHFHMNPTEAVQAFMDLDAKIMIPIHWGAFRLSLEKLEEPLEWLKKIVAERNIEKQVQILKPGESYEL